MTDPAPYVTAADVRAAVSGLSDETKFPDALLERLVARFEELAERYRGVAFTPRSATTTISRHSDLRRRWRLGHTHVTSITSVTVGGITQDIVTVPPTIVPNPLGDILLPVTSWTCDVPSVVAYVHGYETVPPAIIDACCEFVRAEAIVKKGSLPRNVTGERTDLGWIPEPTADPSKGRPTRWVIVNETLNEIPDERIPGLA